MMDWQKEVARLAKELQATSGDRTYQRHQELSKLPVYSPYESKCELGPEECMGTPKDTEHRELNAWLNVAGGETA